MMLYYLYIDSYMFRSYDHLQVEIYTSEINMTGSLTCVNNLKLGCLHSVACIRSGSGCNRMQTPKFKIINARQVNSIGQPCYM
jgi:hypothetical protein